VAVHARLIRSPRFSHFLRHPLLFSHHSFPFSHLRYSLVYRSSLIYRSALVSISSSTALVYRFSLVSIYLFTACCCAQLCCALLFSVAARPLRAIWLCAEFCSALYVVQCTAASSVSLAVACAGALLLLLSLCSLAGCYTRQLRSVTRSPRRSSSSRASSAAVLICAKSRRAEELRTQSFLAFTEMQRR
jgi:hypothetical protein